MDHPEGASETDDVRLGFDRRVRLEFHGSKISSDGGLLLFRELDEVLGLHDIAGGLLRDTRTGHNRLHSLVGLLRQSVFGRLAGYEDVNDADRLALDPVMRLVVGGRAIDAQAASATQMGRFETETLALPANREALADLEKANSVDSNIPNIASFISMAKRKAKAQKQGGTPPAQP